MAVLPADDPLGAALRGGAQRYAREVPSVRVELADPADASLDARLNALETALGGDVDAAVLYLSPLDVARSGAFIRERVARINSRGIALITIGARIELDGVDGHVGSYEPEAATLAGQHLAALAKPQRTLVLCHNDSRGDIERDAAQRLRSAIAEQPGLVLLKEADGGGDAASARKAIAEMVSLFPHAGLAVTLDPCPWIDAPLEWLGGLRDSNANVRFVTLSTDPRLWRLLGTPEAPGLASGLVGGLDADMTYEAVRMAVELIGGERRGHADRWLRIELVTPATLPEFAARYSAAANGVDLSSFLPRNATTRPTSQP